VVYLLLVRRRFAVVGFLLSGMGVFACIVNGMMMEGANE
jgi:hypothetical protein